MFPLVPLTTQDGATLEKIHASCFPEGWDKSSFDRLLIENWTCGWMAQSLEGQPIGFILARTLGSEAEILTFAVAPSFQRLGIGRRLLKKLMVFLVSVECEKVFLEVAVDNKAAIILYSGENFVNVGTRPNYYQRADGSFICAPIMAWTKIKNI